MVGVDVFLDRTNGSPDDPGKVLEKAISGDLKLQMITNRGVKVYPDGTSETFCTDHRRCRSISDEGDKKNRTLADN